MVASFPDSSSLDDEVPPNEPVSQNYQFTVPSVQKSFTYDANGSKAQVLGPPELKKRVAAEVKAMGECS